MNYIQRNASSFTFAFLTLLLIIASLLSFNQIRDSNITAERVNHTNIVKSNLVELISVIKDAEAGQRGYLITYDSVFLEPFIHVEKKILPLYRKLDSLITDNPKQLAQLQILKSLISDRLQLSYRTLLSGQQHQPNTVIDSALMRGKYKMDEVGKQSDIMIQTENILLQERTVKNNRNIKYTPIYALLGSLLCIIFISLAFLRTREESILKQDANEELQQRNYDLQQQKDFVDAVFDASVDIMGVLDKDMIFKKFNKAGLLAYGKSKEELIGKSFAELYPYIRQTGLYAEVQKALKGEIIHQTEYFSPPTKKYFELFLIPLKNRKEEVESVLIIAHDITTIVHTNQQLQQQNLQLEQTNQELASFSYVASHDLKEPLRKIQVFTKRILETETFANKTEDYFNRILSASERMQNLIDSLLNFSLANNTILNFEPCDLNNILAEAKSYLKETILEKHAIVISDNLPVINGLPVQLTQLFTNLVDNAIKYSRKEVTSSLTITCAVVKGKEVKTSLVNKQKEYFLIKFTDNGIGFDQQYEHKIFEIFQRLHGRQDYTGTGIGLAICKKIVTNHNGFISAEGKENTGATFNIYFPKETV